jgi:FixJ family two-component response regulator
LQNRNLVIVVDRDDAVLKSVARLLWSFGYDSVLFSSAEAFANHNDFDEVICAVIDIDSGDVSGIELRHALQAANISVPVIYMTGNDSPAVRKAALQSGGGRVSHQAILGRLSGREVAAASYKHGEA